MNYTTGGLYFLIPSILLYIFENDVSSEVRVNGLCFVLSFLLVLEGVIFNNEDWFTSTNVAMNQ